MPALEVSGFAVGGDGVAREPSGRVVFVPGALPGDVVDVDLVEERDRYARAALRAVVEPSADRVAPPCPEGERGCGGCGLLHASPAAQRRLKRGLVVDTLERIGRLKGPPVVDGPSLPDRAFRTTLRVGVSGGRAGFRRARSHDLVEVGSCMVAHPLLEELLVDGRFGAAEEVTMRAGANTGDRLVVASPTARGVRLPSDVTVVGADELAAGRNPAYAEVVAGRRWQISAGSFFQTRADGAEALVATVAADLAALRCAGDVRLVDAYCGVGLLAAAAPDASVVAIEANPSAAADAAANLTGRPVRVVTGPVERWRPEETDAVVADPARRGLGRAGARVVAATGARGVVLVSCDAGSLGRDAGELSRLGYRLERATLVDLFPHTPHVEVVTRWSKVPGAGPPRSRPASPRRPR